MFDFPSKSSCLKHFPNRAGWLVLAQSGPFCGVAGTIVGTIFVIAIRRSGASITPRVECLDQTTCEVNRGPSGISVR
jgi:hypothetical protein